MHNWGSISELHTKFKFNAHILNLCIMLMQTISKQSKRFRKQNAACLIHNIHDAQAQDAHIISPNQFHIRNAHWLKNQFGKSSVAVADWLKRYFLSPPSSKWGKTGLKLTEIKRAKTRSAAKSVEMSSQKGRHFLIMLQILVDRILQRTPAYPQLRTALMQEMQKKMQLQATQAKIANSTTTSRSHSATRPDF